jgi:hypothetical protein
MNIKQHPAIRVQVLDHQRILEAQRSFNLCAIQSESVPREPIEIDAIYPVSQEQLIERRGENSIFIWEHCFHLEIPLDHLAVPGFR